MLDAEVSKAAQEAQLRRQLRAGDKREKGASLGASSPGAGWTRIDTSAGCAPPDKRTPTPPHVPSPIGCWSRG